MKPTPAVVEAIAGVKEDLHKRHRKDKARVREAWQSLLEKRGFLEQDTTLGDAIPRDRWPRRFADLPNLYRLELVHAFRALYSVAFDPDRDIHVVTIEWVGDHKEYDRLFGYQTS